MTIKSHEDNISYTETGTSRSGVLIDNSHGAQNAFCMGISYYDAEEYGEPGIHDDQEGFYVLEGIGTAQVGMEEFEICPGTSFIAHAGVPHSIKKDSESKSVKVIWCHGAI